MVASCERVAGASAAAYARGKDLERDQPLNSVDPASGVASLGYDAASGRWGGELVTTVVAAKRRVDRSRVDLYRTDSYATLDMLGHVNLGHGLWLDAVCSTSLTVPTSNGPTCVDGRSATR